MLEVLDCFPYETKKIMNENRLERNRFDQDGHNQRKVDATEDAGDQTSGTKHASCRCIFRFDRARAVHHRQ